jgi:hypothetical protein
MKRIPFLVGCITLLLLGASSAYAQSDSHLQSKIDVKNPEEEDEGPIMFKFEPNYISAIESRREAIVKTKQLLDTLDISENKRRKLLKDLYKNEATKRLSKVLVANTSFEDVEN